MSARQRQRGVSTGVLLLGYQLAAVGMENIPPVTLATIAAQVAIFLGFFSDLSFGNIQNICVLPSRIWYSKEWMRLLFSSFVHWDDMHLYYNMISFLWKGRRLERRFGSYYFAFLLAVFSVATNLVLVALSIIGDDYLHLNGGWSRQCAVGFSGVIFALKVLCNHYFPHEDSRVFGWFPMPSKYACWAELVLIQLLVPNASFVGHLAGILVGLAYVHGPLKRLMDLIFHLPNFRPHTSNRYHDNYSSNRYQDDNSYSGDNYYSRYTGGLSEEEQIRRATEESTRHSYPAQPSAPPYYGERQPGLYPRL